MIFGSVVFNIMNVVAVHEHSLRRFGTNWVRCTLDRDGTRLVLTGSEWATDAVWVRAVGLQACLSVRRWTSLAFVRVPPHPLPPKKYRFTQAVCCVVSCFMFYNRACTLSCCFV